ncbi:hypothetical protein EGI26_13625 [Lacihabitans sp. CCS-44]|nr:hypothetical protein [Lacihabitans sp. CCS-44]
MKYFKMKTYINYLIICVLSVSLAQAHESPLIEKRKEFNFNYSAGGVEKLEIANQFGDVKVYFNNQKTITVTVQVTANAPTNGQLDEFIESINVNGQKNGEIVKVYTSIRKENYNMNSWNKDKNSSFKIDYSVYIPKNLELVISNSFGEVNLPDFSAPLTLNLNYCTLQAAKISNPDSKINLNYGVANIKALLGGDINSNFTAVNMGEMRNVNMKNNHGSLKAKYLEDIEGVMNYSGGVFGNIKEAVKLNVNFSKNFTIENIDEKVKKLEIFSNYSNIDLPISEKFNGVFDVKTSHGTFYVDPALMVHFFKNSETDGKKSGYKPKISNSYQGKIGTTTNTDTKILIISNFGDVKIK